MNKINLNTLTVGMEYWSTGYDMSCETIPVKVKYLGKKNGNHITESDGVRIIHPNDWDHYGGLVVTRS
jgi:hypothetical protein